MDIRQDAFETFEVPDPIRILKVSQFLRSYFSKVGGLMVLECGVARGGLAEMLQKEGAHCFGVDINPRVGIHGVEIAQADLNNGFPRFNQKFDVIFAGEVMEHLFDDNKFIRAAKELLAPGGLLILTVPNLVFSVNRVRMFFGKTPFFAYEPYHYHMYTARTLRELIQDEGLRVIKMASSHVFFSTRRNKLGRIFEILGDYFPSFGAHLMVYAKKD